MNFLFYLPNATVRCFGFALLSVVELDDEFVERNDLRILLNIPSLLDDDPGYVGLGKLLYCVSI